LGAEMPGISGEDGKGLGCRAEQDRGRCATIITLLDMAPEQRFGQGPGKEPNRGPPINKQLLSVYASR
jgi:hypothetical protein